jgi:hypothetical protein
MGSPLSPVFSEFFLQYLESQVVKENNIFYYKRYVDDFFPIIKEGTQETILNELNNFDANIQFTFELENNKKLPFLDICVMRNDDRSISKKVYRTPTHSGRYLNFSSYHHFSHKLSIIDSLLYELFTLFTNLSKMKFH